jgi:hypothetical protein
MKGSLGMALAALMCSPLAAQSMQGHDMQGHQMTGTDQMPGMAAELHEGGQSAFAAIAEATRALEADPATDWSKVNIDALRQHLVDMDNVTLHSDVATVGVANGAQFTITSADPRVQASINHMVHLHSGMANHEGPYKYVVADVPTGVSLTVTGASPADAAKIRALGFFGLLTEGVHHPLHHMMLARGEQMHH